MAEMRAAGPLTIRTDAEFRETWTLTPDGAQVARQMAMSGEEDAFELMSALLDARSEARGR